MTCGVGETMLVTHANGSPHIALTQPALQYQRNITRSVIEDQASFLKILKPDLLNKSMSLGLVYDLRSKQTRYIFGPAEIFSSKQPLLLCTKKIPDVNHILQVQSFGAVSEK